MPEPLPTCGRVVHYVVASGPRMGCRRPLLVTAAEGDVVNGHVFFEPMDHPTGLAPDVEMFGEGGRAVQLRQTGQLVIYVQHVERGSSAADPGTWLWPSLSPGS